MSKTLSKKTRFFIGLSDPAGIGTTYAKTLRKMGYQANCITYSAHPFGYNSDPQDYSLDLFSKNIVWRLIYLLFFFLKAIFFFDVFIFVYGATFFPFRNRFFVNIDMPILKFFGKKIMMVFVGCDIRYRYQKGSLPFSSCFECKEVCDFSIKRKIAENTERYADLVVSHPDCSELLKKKYHYAWMPIDLKKYQPNYLLKNKKIVVIHAPSDRAIKGTKYIVEAVRRLKKEGLKFEFKLLEKINHEEVLKNIKKADIVVDSVLGGWYGAFALESMALGKVVLGYLRPENLKTLAVPMLNSSPDNLYANLKKALLMSPAQRIKLGKKARLFAEKHHNENQVVKRMLEWFKK